MKLKFTLLALVMAYFCRDGARGQSFCVTQFNQVTATGVSTTIDNRFTMCSLWIVTYNTHGFTAVSIELDTANDLGGTAPNPGTFALSTGTVLAGANPSTAVNCQTTSNCQFIINGYAPFVRLNFSSKTGTGGLTALGFGYPAAVPIIATIAAGTLCTAGTPCVVDGPDAAGTPSTKAPVQIAGNDGTNVRRIATDTSGRTVVVGAAAIGSSPAGNPLPSAFVDSADKLVAPQVCTSSGTFDISAAGNTLLIAASGTTQIRLCHFSAIDVGTGNTFQLKQGTGATCAVGPSVLGQIYTSVLTVAQDYTSPLIAAASNAVCINLTNATRVVGEFQFAQY
jgi:hypothetical protein